MKRLAMIAITGIMALMISACGDNAPQKPEMQTDDVQSQSQPSAISSSGSEEQASSKDVTDSDATESDDSAGIETTQPSDDAIEDTTAQE